MTVNEKATLAKAYFEEGYNCAQAVLLAFSEEAGLTSKQAARIAFGQVEAVQDTLFAKTQLTQRGGRAPSAPGGLIETELHFAFSIKCPVSQCQACKTGGRRS